MSPPKPLCEYCAKIPLGDLNNAPTFDEWQLGPGSRIQNSDCPFCGVIVRAFQTQYQTDSWHRTPPLSDRPNVLLRWWSFTGPSDRGAFEFDGVLICAAQPSSRQGHVQKHEYWLPAVDAKFDIGRLETWISTCAQHHSGRCRVKRASFEDSFPGLDVVRFVDVMQSSVVELRTVPRYVALSYVWGEAPTIRLTTTSRAGLFFREELRRPGAVSPGRSRTL